MKKRLSFLNSLLLAFLIVGCVVVASPIVAQDADETQVNQNYREIIMAKLKRNVSDREKAMQRGAEAYLESLSQERRLYDDSEVTVRAKLADGLRDDGKVELNYVLEISYNCQNSKGVTDDYPSGAYRLEQSNSALAICELAQRMVSDYNADLVTPGRKVSVRVASSADALGINKIDYGGEYGDWRYQPGLLNGEQSRFSLSTSDGITNNVQLAFARALGVRDYLESSIPALQQTVNDYYYIVRCARDTGSYLRRISVEITVHSPFDDTIITTNKQLIDDDYVEYNIPLVKANSNPNTYVLIVANEDYDAPLPDCEYAWRDGQVFRDYCIRTLGIPERQVIMLNNASRNTLRTQGVDWLQKVLTATRGGDVIVYYAGHGVTDGEYHAYLMPCEMNYYQIKAWVGKRDMDAEKMMTRHDSKALFEQCVMLDTLCAWLQAVPSNSMTLILDASFNNMQRTGGPLLTVQRTTDKVKAMRLRGNMVIIFAANIQKQAFVFEQQHHGFLTYYLLKELKRTQGDIDYKTMIDNIRQAIAYESALQGKLQEIEVLAGGTLKDTWGSLRFR